VNLRRRNLSPVSPPSPKPQKDSPDETGGASAEPTPARLTRSEKDAARRTQILEGNIHRAVLAVAIPSVATMLLQTTNGLLDSFFVGTLGPDALAAITVGSSLMFALMSAAMAVSVGTTALVARFVGEGHIQQGENVREGDISGDAVTATRQSLILGVVFAVLVGLPMYFLREPLLTALGLVAAAHELSATYLSIIIFGMPSMFLMFILNGAFRGLGDTVRPFWVSLAANIIHVIFNYLLIFGKFGFPKLGLAGGAIALVISQVASTVIYLLFLRQTSLAPALTGGWKLDLDWAKRICRIGIPASVQQIIRVGSMLAFQGLLARTDASSAAIAALGVGLRFESIAFMPGFGYSIAASAFVGQNLGAGKIERANAGAWAATWQAVGIMTFMGLVFAAAAEPFARLFIRHGAAETPMDTALVNETILLTVAYLRIAIWSEPFLALGMVLTGALQGAGETMSPTAITIATMIFVRLPLGWLFLFGLHLPTTAGWWAMTITTIVQGILMVWVFRKGRWRTVKV
jgi:putative MATE family efflux protein